MGASLVAQVYTYWSHLPDRPHRLLTHMALVVLDASVEPTYWAGREAMCQALGLAEGTEASRQTVKMTVRRLIDAGAIERVVQGHSGKRSEYRLLLHRGNGSVPLRGNESVPLRGNASDPQRGNERVPTGVTPPTPPGGLKKTEEHTKRKSPLSLPSPRVTQARASKRSLDDARTRLDEAAS